MLVRGCPVARRDQPGLQRRLQLPLGDRVLSVFVGAQPGQQGLLGRSLGHVEQSDGRDHSRRLGAADQPSQSVHSGR